MSAKIIDLGAHERMTPEETVVCAGRANLSEIVVCGFNSDNGLVVMSSHMSRELALWLIEHAKLHIMDRL